MAQYSDKTVLITGATDGIGLALARRYGTLGARLVLVGRRDRSTLDPSLFNAANYCQVDLSLPECGPRIDSWLEAHSLDRLDLVIHNAGLGYVGDVEAQSAKNIQALVAVNLVAPIAVTHHLLPRVEAAAGKLAYISSVASVFPGPDYAVYSASKAALDGFVRNLQIELASAKSPASAHLIHPGATRTGMHEKSGLPLDQVDWTRFPPAHEVAAQIMETIEQGRRRRAIGTANRFALAAGLGLPGTVEAVTRRKAIRHAPSTHSELPPPGRHCVITGAADGIGRALAYRFASEGYTITGVDIDRERAMRTQAEIINQGGKARFIIADLSSAEDMDGIIAQIGERPPVDTLIHNAGISAAGPFATSPLQPQLTVLGINFLAPLLLTAGLLAHQRLATGSLIICMASLSHFVGYPGAAVYAASKDGLVSYARSLSVALAPRKVDLLTVFPGPTRTAHARRYSPDNRNEARRMEPSTLAGHIFGAAKRRDRSLIPGVGNRGFAVAGRLFPRLTEEIMRRTILEKLRGPGEMPV